MSAAAAPACFHCGEPVPAGTRFGVVIDGALKAMCCAGCAAVAGIIVEHGLTGYYASRSALPQRDAPDPVEREAFTAYDIPAVQKPFVRASAGGLRQAALLIEGITCGACAWLIERRLLKLDGVSSVAVNLAARRAQIEWDDGEVHLSEILQAIAELGYRTQGFDSAVEAAMAVRERRAMLWRLFVAGLAMMQVMMYAAPVYLAGGDMTADAERLMRWASLTLTVPVMLW